MSGWNIRSRLTLAIVVMTLVVLALGLWFGMGVLETQVKDAAIDERIELFEDLGFDGVVFEDGAIDAGVATEIFDELIGGEVISVEPFDSTFELFVIQNLIDEPEVFGQLVGAFGTDDNRLLIWLGPDEIISIDSAGRAAIVDDPPTPAVPVTDLFDLDTLGFDRFGSPSPSERLELAFGERTFGTTRIGFFAEVSEGLDALDEVRNTMAIAVAILTVLAGIATWFIAGRALRPVGAITDQVRAITSGTLSDRVPEPGSADEIGVLARTMNTMLGRLETSDLKRRQFVSDASHELRTPVAVLRNEAEVARRAPDSTTIDDFAAVVLNESGRLERLVEDLLALARGDESRTLASTSTVDVDEVVLTEALRSRAIPVDKSAVSAGRVVGHADVMTRVIAHLLDNAARHAERRVAVGVQTVGEVVRIWVDDDGPGISEDERQRIFERFIRLDDARTRDRGGAGLGLAVVHSAVEQMDGTIAVLDSSLGGARFQIEFPAAS